MTDREKVIDGIKNCISFRGIGQECDLCPYAVEEFGRCVGKLMEDALKLLKEQEPVMWLYDGYNRFCSNCGVHVEDEVHYMMDKPISFCPACGRKVKWE